MAKDPAMLWYWSDWNGGTVTLSRHLKGCYMDLLHAQFNSGHLHIEEIKTVLGPDFDNSWPVLQKKFLRDPDGLFFNVRLDEEKIKRANFTASRRRNLEQKPTETPHTDSHMDGHMENENVNTNINGNEVRKGVQGKTISREVQDMVFMDEDWFATLKMHFPGYNYEEVWSKCYAWHVNRPHPPNSAWQWREKFRNWLSRMEEKKYEGKLTAGKKKLTFEEIQKARK